MHDAGQSPKDTQKAVIISYWPWNQQLFIYSKSHNVRTVLFYLRGGSGSIKKDDNMYTPENSILPIPT